ncbi:MULTISPECIES: polyphosphate kinase 1 [Prosthecochloris]|uniref:Polyphosphate kinase n=1 Tax=Prosthecochloris marina TaxID=2017681 RepID=A0A317T9N3_9CHLB|nr:MULTISPECIES: polyphosphate kinase 1 [Prosthecochloris]PWW83394.1 polyphosphate kinase 1 [Prosthecochloris marina]UZJ38671.1 polyphosphate kinase 1 [Prosthecochloris sp. SCSIO W1103]
MDQNAESVKTSVKLHDFEDIAYYVNRELSWVSFNQRVLEEALSPDAHPLFERVKFISIFSSNLDEFFMIRVAGLQDQYEAGIQDRSVDGLTPQEQIEKIRERVIEQFRQRNDCFYNDICPKLNKNGIEFVEYKALDENKKKGLQKYFRNEIFPVLTPLAVDPGHPFPFVSNLSLNLAVELEDLETRVLKFARVKVPSILPRILRLDTIEGLDFKDEKIRLLWLEDLIQNNLEQLFPHMRVVQSHPFRVIRDADIEIEEDEAGDLLETIEKGIRSRRYGKVVRLDVTPTMPQSVRKILIKNLEVNSQSLYEISGVLGMSDLMEMMKIEKPELKDEPFAPHNPIEEKVGGDVFCAIRQGDHLLYHPYDSFQPVVDLINQAANDPQVLSIKQTLYRVGNNSPVVKALMSAVEQRKQVAVLVELKARFDEENNIGWARALEDVGAHVVYGLVGLKTHAKLTLIVRKEHDKLKRYLHLGTGNYNPFTAKIYTDYSYLTANDVLANDVSELFNALTGYSKHTTYRKLIVSPVNTRQRIIEMIEREIEWHEKEGNGRIIMKMNALVDRKTIKSLYRASCAGVSIDLIIRGICCLIPGIKGVSEHIRVISVIGRFLEHSRAYYFRNGGMDELYLGSADVMPRNLDHRVEALFPIMDKELIDVAKSELELILGDNVKAWEMNAQGAYIRVTNNEPEINSQKIFLNQASKRKSISKFKVNGL